MKYKISIFFIIGLTLYLIDIGLNSYDKKVLIILSKLNIKYGFRSNISSVSGTKKNSQSNFRITKGRLDKHTKAN